MTGLVTAMAMAADRYARPAEQRQRVAEVPQSVTLLDLSGARTR